MSEALELEHLVRLRQDFRDAITNAISIGAEPADVITCLAHALGETFARAGYASPPPEVLLGIASSIRTSCSTEHKRRSQPSTDTVFKAGSRRKRR